MDTLKLTTCAPGFFGSTDVKSMRFHPTENDISPIILPSEDYRCSVYIHGDAEELAGYDIPIIFAGDVSQLSAPVGEQSIEMYLEDQVYQLQSKLRKDYFGDEVFYLTLK